MRCGDGSGQPGHRGRGSGYGRRPGWALGAGGLGPGRYPSGSCTWMATEHGKEQHMMARIIATAAGATEQEEDRSINYLSCGGTTGA